MILNLLNWIVKESHTCKNTCGRMEVNQEAGWGSTTGNGGTGSRSQYLAGSCQSQEGMSCSWLPITGTSSVNCSNVSTDVVGEGCGGAEASWILVGKQ